MLRNAKSHFFDNLHKGSQRQFWKSMKYLRKEECTIPNLSHNGVTADNKVIVLNHFFSQCYNSELPSFLHTKLPEQYKVRPEDILCIEEEVTYLLQTIDVSKSSGPDKISGRIQGYYTSSIAPKLFSLPISPGCVSKSRKSSI